MFSDFIYGVSCLFKHSSQITAGSKFGIDIETCPLSKQIPFVARLLISQSHTFYTFLIFYFREFTFLCILIGHYFFISLPANIMTHCLKSTRWLDRRIIDLLHIEHPIIQAPMAGANDSRLAIAVANVGGLGSIPCATFSPEKIEQEVKMFRAASSSPLNLNFFAHKMPVRDDKKENEWKESLRAYYDELGVPFETTVPSVNRAPFDEGLCSLVEKLRPEVVSFHFGLPVPDLVHRVKATGATIISSATTVEEAMWLEKNGCDAIIATGFEAGGHRGMFLTEDLLTQVGTISLVSQIVDRVSVPVIAAGGIGDARGIAAAMTLGASGVQLGTAYLFTPEAITSPAHYQALRTRNSSQTAVTNIFTGRPARGIVNRVMKEMGPMTPLAPPFPLAGGALAPLREACPEEFSSLWAGQGFPLGIELPAAELTRQFIHKTLDVLNLHEKSQTDS